MYFKKIVFFVMLFAVNFAYANTNQQCTEANIKALKKDAASLAVGEHDFYSVSCKVLPNNNKRILSSYIMESDKKHGYWVWRVALLDSSTGTVTSGYTGYIDDDASTRVDSSSIWLDTARYYVNENNRAFGVRLDIGYGPQCAQGGRTSFLTLFLVEKNVIKPILNSLPTSLWTLREGDTCSKSAVVIERGKSSLQIQPTQTSGFNDIKVVTSTKFIKYFPDYSQEIINSRKIYKTLKFNGKEYPVNVWDDPGEGW